MNDERHPLYGKDTSCHKCSGVAVWVFNGAMVGNYHYCRTCKIETGPFAEKDKSPPPAPPSKDDYPWSVQYTMNDDGSVTFTTLPFTQTQIDTQMDMQARVDQLLLDFMNPPSQQKCATGKYWQQYLDSLDELADKADHPV